LFAVGNAESHLTEDGGNRVTFVDRKTGSLRGEVELALGHPNGITCPAFPVPFVSPNGPPTFPVPNFPPSPAITPVPLLSPNPSWGCFPDPNGIAVGRDRDGKRYLFTANGGTDDVSVIDLDAALAGGQTAEIARIATQIGPWGITTSPNGRWVVAANRESQRVPFEGNTISIIGVDLQVEVARVLVGTIDPATQTRPFIPSFTPDGQQIIVPNFRANNVSIVDFDPPGAVFNLPLTRPDGAASRPKGSAVTADGRYAVISGGARTAATGSGTVWIIHDNPIQVERANILWN
jgi:DNA-binding beta-propeller fold protein YncE